MIGADINRLIQRSITKIKLPFQSVIKASKFSGEAFLYSLKNGLSSQDREEIENLQHYGFISRMPAGTRIVTIPRGGKTENLVIVSEEHKTAISLAEGDVAIERETGEYVWIKNGEIEVKADQVVVNCVDSAVNCTGNTSITASGNVDANGTNVTAVASAQATVSAPVVDVTASTSASVTAPTVSVTATVLATITAATLNVVSAVQMTVTSLSVLLGSVAGAKALITEAAMSILNGHTHQDSMGGTTSAPSATIGASETTTITKAA